MSEIKNEIDDIFEQPGNLLEEIKMKTSNKDNRRDEGFVNNKGSILLRDDGECTIISDKYSQYKTMPDGNTLEVSKQSNTVTVRKNIETDEIVINKHKMNPQLYELADMRMYNNIPHTAIGGLTLFSTVLVKAWEPTLKKWVLIRRLARVPAFSTVLNSSEVPDNLDLNLNLSEDILKMSEGWKDVN